MAHCMKNHQKKRHKEPSISEGELLHHDGKKLAMRKASFLTFLFIFLCIGHTNRKDEGG